MAFECIRLLTGPAGAQLQCAVRSMGCQLGYPGPSSAADQCAGPRVSEGLQRHGLPGCTPGFAHWPWPLWPAFFSKSLKLAERLIRTDKTCLGAPVGAFPFDMEVLGGVPGFIRPVATVSTGRTPMMELVITAMPCKGARWLVTMPVWFFTWPTRSAADHSRPGHGSFAAHEGCARKGKSLRKSCLSLKFLHVCHLRS